VRTPRDDSIELDATLREPTLAISFIYAVSAHSPGLRLASSSTRPRPTRGLNASNKCSASIDEGPKGKISMFK
jgi:hypothetical protein